MTPLEQVDQIYKIVIMLTIHTKSGQPYFRKPKLMTPATPLLILFIPFLLFFPACTDANTDDSSAAPVFISNEKPYKHIIQETVIIDSQEYIIPASWQGQRLGVKALTKPPLVQVPPEFVKDGGTIYLLPEACEAFKTMAEEAKQNDIAITIDSGYRSAWYQKKIYKRLMEKGKSFEEVARYVAPPGYSEHMLGLAVDFHPSDWRFVDSPVYPWLKKHAEGFGFSETYPESSPDNKPWEPSHWRYHSPSPLISE